MDVLTTEDPPGIGSYRLLAHLGAGGMGRVYLARSEGGRTVAVKVVQDEYARHPEFRQRFASEVAAARRVGGKWTAPVLDADTEAAVPWVATGYVPGPDLHRVVARDHGPLPEYSVRALACGLAHALKAIHGSALIHRDLKPSNILLTVDGPRVIDFGIARALDTVADGVRTRTGAVLGSPGFMSPEQVRGHRLTPASDVFCLGSVLAYAATGKTPFGTSDSGAHAVMYRIAELEPVLDGVPDGVLALVRACLAKDPAARPTVEQLLEWTRDAGTENGRPWLPGPLLAQLGRHAAELLDADAPASGRRPSDTHTAPPHSTGATIGADQGPTRRPRPRPRTRATRIAAAVAAVAVAAVATVVLTRADDGTPDDDRRAGAADSGDRSGGQPAGASVSGFGGAWEGFVQRSDSSVADEHEYLRIDVDGAAAPGEKAASFVYLGKYTYCKVEAALRSKHGDTMTLASYKVVKAVPATAADDACDLSRSSGLTASDGRLGWSMGDATADLKRAAKHAKGAVPAAFVGTWESELQGTLTIRQGAVGSKAGTYDGWSVDWRCDGKAELVSATGRTLTLSPMELDTTTPRNIGCPSGSPATITRKSDNELELRYPESVAIRLTRAQ